MFTEKIRRRATFIYLSVILLNCFTAMAVHPQSVHPLSGKTVAQNKSLPASLVSSKVDMQHNSIQLTKVELKGVNNLEPFADPEDKGYNDTKKSLIGLMVLHTGNQGSKMPQGVYVWNGEKWLQAQCDL
ncbi:hypothetical protein E2605_11545 [Dysgonomonas capnocytophagoides]|uniref:Uncharacterized protein n=1 Tax=Dysgonomonas capnocytophagoides TaxID=45254 RepID=A0A4Y8L2E4_9BACT|nr:hypothetical protein [Dysgonomonas capnocytophagoides]TFD96218.1 hypothetical protein E2605_11545 [Dysgonomonas capnocytophagoides]